MEYTPENELNQILEKQKTEAEWWSEYPAMKTEEDIKHQIESGNAMVVPNVGTGYKISEKVRPEFRVLKNNTVAILNTISERWLKRVRQEKGEGEAAFLVISSLARTEEFQQQLIQQGYPAAENSTHTKLGAFDIAVRWFEKHAPEMKKILTDILEELEQESVINVIDEPTIGVYHVASNPSLLR